MSDFSASVHFGGPDYEPRALRNLLASSIAAVPSGGRIHWATYYLRDRQLAQALVEAKGRGVDVRLVLEAAPRTKIANRAVEEIVSGPLGLGSGFTRRRERKVFRAGHYKRPRLHTKLYYFSHPLPVAYIGSFNASCDVPELMPEIIEELRDQDLGYNVLVGMRNPALVDALLRHAEMLETAPQMSRLRRAPESMRVESGAVELFSLPRQVNPVDRLLSGLRPGTRLRVVASHMRGSSSIRLFCTLAERGVDVEVLCDDTQRRVPEKVLRKLSAAGAQIRRFAHSDDIPMHSKFLLIDGDGPPRVSFGSFNWSGRSRIFNREVGAISTCPELVKAFEAHWLALAGSPRVAEEHSVVKPR